MRAGPSYWGYPTRGVAVILRCGEGLLATARRHAPQGQRLTVVVNAADTVVDNRPALALAAAWQAHGRPRDRPASPQALRSL